MSIYFQVTYQYNLRLTEVKHKPASDTISGKRTDSAGGHLSTSYSTVTYCSKISGHLIRRGTKSSHL